MKIAIMTDTNSGIRADEGARMGVFVLPMPVIIEETSYLEGISIDSQTLYAAIREGKSVSTSQPSPGDVTAMWDQILAEGYDRIVYLPMSSGLSGSCHSASMLAEDYGGRVLVADNHRISVTLRESVLDALEMVQDGLSAEEICAALEAEAKQQSIYITVPSLHHLQKGGRLSASAMILGTALNIKPILTIQGEKIESFAKGRGVKQCEKKMIEAMAADVAERFSDVPAERLQICTAGTLAEPEDVEQWCAAVRKAFPNSEIYYAPLPCSIACHVGLDCRGLALSVRRSVR